MTERPATVGFRRICGHSSERGVQNKGTEEKQEIRHRLVEIRCRLVARDFRGAEKDREDLFAATPPWEAEETAHVTRGGQAHQRQSPQDDVKKAHECTEDVVIELPEEAGAAQDKVVKLERWLCGFRPVAAPWEAHCAYRLEEVGFRRGGWPLRCLSATWRRTSIWWFMVTTFTGDDASSRWAEEIMS